MIDLVQISEHGLAYLAGLKYVNISNFTRFSKFILFRNLKQVDLARLPGIKNREAVIRLLKTELPQCTINYNDEHPSAPELKDK